MMKKSIFSFYASTLITSKILKSFFAKWVFALVLLVAGNNVIFAQATLPVATTNLSKATLPTGFSHFGLGSDYSGPKLKFDDANDYLVLFFSGTSGTLTFDVGVNNTFPGSIPSTATFTVQESDAGSSWTTLGTYSNVAGGTKTLSPASTTRYIRWYYTTKPTGTNITLFNINLTAGVALCTAPTTQATIFTSSAITQTAATAGWTRGNGDNVLVVARAGGAVNADPVSGTAYTANAAFGSGTQIGTGNYVVYNGTGTSVSLTALTAGTQYHFAVYEYNTTGTCYNTTELTGNFTTLYNAPAINSSLTASGNVGSAFSYTITATNTPTSFSATGLPSGLSINTSTGVISGTPAAAATTNVTIGATNNGGSDSKTLVITIGAAITNCIDESFTGWTHAYGNWTHSSNGTWTGFDIYAGSNRIQMNDMGDYLELPPLNNPSSLQYSGALSSNESITNGNRIKVQYYNGSSWVDIVEHTATTTTFNTYTADLSVVNSQTGVRVRLYRSVNNRTHYIDDVVVTCQVSTDPLLTVNAGSLDFGTVCNGSTSAEQSFTISGSNLTAGNISLAALSGYTYSETSGGTFTSTLSFSQPGGTLAAKTIYVKLTPTAPNATYNGNIVISGGGASDVNKAVTGNSTAITGAVVTNTASSVAGTSATLRASSSTFSTCPATTAKGFVYAITSVNSAPISGGTGVTTSPNGTLDSGGAFTQAITGLAEGTTYTYQAYLFDGTTYIYGGIQTFQTTVTSPSNVTAAKACLTDNAGTISWTAPSTAPTGYMVFAIAAATAGTGSPTTLVTDYATVNNDFSVATTYASLGKLLYKGNLTSADITGLTEDVAYSFRIFAYNEGAELRNFANGTTAGAKAENSSAQDDVKTFTGTPSNNQVTLNWTYNAPLACFDEVIIVANQGAVSFTPTGDGSAYTANDVYTSSNQVVYKGSANSKTITGLTNELEYCFKIFVRRGTEWSDGTSVCATPDIAYCASSGDMSYQTGVTYVQFQEIENATPTKTQGYTLYNTPKANVYRGESIPLTVRVNTAGSYTVYTKAWIDWNHNGSFNDSGEEVDLGSANSVTDGITSLSPVTITVPNTAYLGDVRMRISAKFSSAATSCQTSFDGEVEDYILTITQPTDAEINVKGAGNNIPNGADTPYAFNNTIFATTPINEVSAEKVFTIQNFGLADLNLTGSPIIKIEGTNAADFIVTQPTTTTVLNGIDVTFKIKFHPTLAGLKTANVRIDNSDSDENPYIFAIQGTGNCTIEPTVDIFPTSGPANTLVKFTSTSSLMGSSVTFNNESVPITYQSATTVEVLIPDNSNDGNFTIQLATGCSKTLAFEVIDTDLTDCEASAGGGTNASDLVIYEVYDENGGSGGVITIFNRTGASVDLSDYSIERAGDYGGTYKNIANLSGTIAANAVAIIGVTITPNCGFTTTGNGSFGQGFNANDGFRLMNGVTLIDDVKAPNYVGYYLKRKNTSLNPNTTYTDSEWTKENIDEDQCLTGIGEVPLIKVSPTIVTNPGYVINCQEISTTLTVEGVEGVTDGLGLAYQWYVLGTSGSWTAITDGGIYSGATTATLAISDTTGTKDYQYYCQIRENSATCFTATQSTLVRIEERKWDGTDWIGREDLASTAPEINQKIILAANYTTGTNGSFTGCSLKNNATFKLTISPGAAVTIDSNIDNQGSMEVESDGNLIQINDDAIFTGNDISVKRNSQLKRLDYTYWAAPVSGQNLKTFSPGTVNSRFLIYNESNDEFESISPLNNTFDANGKGYAIRAANNSGTTLGTFVGNFVGNLNNGVKSISLDFTDGDHGFNLVGNPYASNLNFYDLHTNNTGVIYNTAYFWTNVNPNPAMQGGNYPGTGFINNYAILNGVGGVPATGTSENGNGTPNEFIKVGQGFIVKAKQGALLNFKNTIRTSNSTGTFFNKNGITPDRFWLQLKTPLNVVTTQLIGYKAEATNGFELDYDSPLLVLGSDAFFSVLEGKKLAIQGKATFTNTDVVNLGTSHYADGTYTISLNKKEGIFSTDQKIYLKDNLTGIMTNLSEGNYTFTAQKGLTEGRFEIKYIPETFLDTNHAKKEDLLVYRDGNNFVVKSNTKNIDQIELYDSSGRLFYTLQPHTKNVIIPGERLSNGVYVLKIKQKEVITTKKIMK